MGAAMTMLQDEAEIARLVEIAKQEEITSYLEIGAKFGGSLRRVAGVMPKGSRIVAIDLPKGTKAWPESKVALEGALKELREQGHETHLIWGDSTSKAVIEQAKNLAPFDLIFIDANHTAAFVAADWKNYSSMGRIIALHDIAWHRAPEWVGTRIDVPQFWSGIKDQYRHEEIKFCPTRKNNGIGVIWRS